MARADVPANARAASCVGEIARAPAAFACGQWQMRSKLHRRSADRRRATGRSRTKRASARFAIDLDGTAKGVSSRASKASRSRRGRAAARLAALCARARSAPRRRRASSTTPISSVSRRCASDGAQLLARSARWRISAPAPASRSTPRTPRADLRAVHDRAVPAVDLAAGVVRVTAAEGLLDPAPRRETRGCRATMPRSSDGAAADRAPAPEAVMTGILDRDRADALPGDVPGPLGHSLAGKALADGYLGARHGGHPRFRAATATAPSTTRRSAAARAW